LIRRNLEDTHEEKFAHSVPFRYRAGVIITVEKNEWGLTGDGGGGEGGKKFEWGLLGCHPRPRGGYSLTGTQVFRTRNKVITKPHVGRTLKNLTESITCQECRGGLGLKIVRGDAKFLYKGNRRMTRK